MLQDIASGLAYLHDEAGLVHGDIKPGNLYQCSNRWTIGDFGIAGRIGTQRGSSDLPDGTPRYMAPEVFGGVVQAPATDIWSLGRTVFDALTVLDDVQVLSSVTYVQVERVMRVLAGSPEIPSSVGPKWTRLLEQMLDPDPASRPTAQTVRTEAQTLPASE